MSARSVEFLQIEPTRHCNFHCLFCQGRFLPKAELETGVLKRALAGLEGVRYVEFQGEGEPFLYPGYFDACRAILERFPGAEISTISNGSTLVPAVRGKLAGGPVAHILVSMETSDPDDFRFLRGGDLTQILENVRELKSSGSEVSMDTRMISVSCAAETSPRSLRTSGNCAPARTDDPGWGWR
ncbi:MAG TPA: radical SAM protein [Spirochaetales bacterium]|nr:radical SAM protein [Spirochaetales bacterium]